MKKHLLFAAFLLMIASCETASGPSDVANLQTHPFFPYAVGDEYVWQVNDHYNDTTYTRTWKVTATKKEYYFVHVSDEYLHSDIKVGQGPALRRDTDLYRVSGDSVFNRRDTREGLLLDFSHTYEPGGGSTFRYVKDTNNVVVPAGTFSGKIMRWDEGRHVYAQGVGMIYSEFIFGGFYEPVEIVLLSAKVGGRSYP
jgi:hypothetical protein